MEKIGKVALDEDRLGAPFGFLNGQFFRKVSSEQTGGALCVFDTVRSAPGGPALHLHFEQDEWFYVTEGQFDIRIGDETYHLGPGDSILAPRGIPHAFANTSQTGRIMVTFAPAGSMEAYFAEASSKSPFTPADNAELSLKHGMKVVGPPIAVQR